MTTPPADSNTTVLNNLAIQSDGSVVLVGSTTLVTGPLSFGTRGYLARILPNGTPEATFAAAVAGSTTLANLLVNSVAIGDDDTITVGGTDYPTSGTDSIDVARFLTTETADAGFGFSGRYTVLGNSAPNVVASQEGLALTPTGEIMVSGERSVRYGTSPSLNVLLRLLPVRVSTQTNDYDGDGASDISALITDQALYAYRPSSGSFGGDSLTLFGAAGVGASISTPGDYDGDGKTDVAAYIPQYTLYAYRPSSGRAGDPDAWTGFGLTGPGETVPTSSIPYAQAPTVSGMALASSEGAAGVPIALTDNVLAEQAGLAGKKKHA